MHALIQAGQPVVHLHLRGIYDLSSEFFRWEMATTLAGWRIGINPFDQPNEAGSPTSSITFGVLKMAQTLSDRQALLDARPRRRAITFHLGKDVVGGLKKPMEVLT